MKWLYRISLFFVTAATFFSAGVISKVYLDSHKIIKQQSNRSFAVVENETYVPDVNENVTEASALDEEKISGQTNYIVRNYDKKTGTFTDTSEMIPAKYIGLTRERLEEELEEYTISPSLVDQEKGFVSASLESFSADKIVVRKDFQVVEEEEVPEFFYLVAEDNYVTVYKSDMKTVYLYTEIDMDSLPYEIQTEILDRKYIEDEEELYNFLESYSS